MIVSLVLSRLDYGNTPLSRLPEYQFRCLQSVINAATRSIYNQRWSDHVTPALVELHWLSAVNRVDFKVATLLYRCLHDLAPPYLSSTLHRVAEVDSRRRLSYQPTLISFEYRSPGWLPLAIACFWLPGHEHGTTYQKQYAQHRRCHHLNGSLRPFYFCVL